MSNEIRIIKYDHSLKSEWNKFVSRSRQQNIIFQRDYIDYHGERFEDCSLLAFKGSRILGILPCEISGDSATSHRGLTFGGWLTPENHFDVGVMEEIMIKSIDFFENKGVKKLTYKPVTNIYLSRSADEDKWVISQLGGKISDITLYWVGESAKLKKNMRPTIRHELGRDRHSNITISQSNDWNEFYEILARRLKEKYNSEPVHSHEEIIRLKNLFPLHILLYCAYSPEGEMLGGTIVYKSKTVIKTQYIATTERGRKEGIIPLILSRVCEDHPDSLYIDMGSSMEGEVLNWSLALNKYLLGMRPIAGYTMELTL